MFTSIRFVMALLTVLAIVGKPLIPPKTLVLHPSEHTEDSLYGPVTGDQPATRWLDESIHYLRCEFVGRDQSVPCGITFKWNQRNENECVDRTQFNRCATVQSDPDGDGLGTENGKSCLVIMEGTNRTTSGDLICTHASSDPDGDGWGWENDESCMVVNDKVETSDMPVCTTAASDPDGDGWGWENEQSCRMVEPAEEVRPCTQAPQMTSVDATGYDGLSVKVHYEGRSSYLRLNVIDAAPELLAMGMKPKPMTAFISTEDLRTGSVLIGLDELSVEEWWTIAQNPPRRLAVPSFGHLTEVAFDADDQGVHRLRVDEIKLIGERIDTETYLLAIAMLWVAFLLVESGWRYYRLRIAYQQEQELLVDLVGGAHTLEAEKVQLKSRTHTDPLTSALNRNGLFERLQEQYGKQQLQADIGLLIFDIDHFKAINDTYGHEAGDSVLQDFSALIASTIRAEDIFARWGGEEFLLVVDQVSEDKLMFVAEKLRQLVADHAFLGDKKLTVTVSIGATGSQVDDHFEALFKRADKALYQAKITRNTTKYAP